MSQLQVRIALETQLASITPAIDTVFEDMPYVPQAGKPYQRVHLLPVDPANPCIGGGFHRLQGIFQVMLCYPAGLGAGVSASRAEQIQAAFQVGGSVSAGGVVVTIASTPHIAAGVPDGDRFCVPVRVRYFANIVE